MFNKKMKPINYKQYFKCRPIYELANNRLFYVNINIESIEHRDNPTGKTDFSDLTRISRTQASLNKKSGNLIQYFIGVSLLALEISKADEIALTCVDCFCVKLSNFFSLFKLRWHAIGCINNDTVVGLCSDLLMRLSYYIFLEYFKKLSSHMVIETWSFRL